MPFDGDQNGDNMEKRRVFPFFFFFSPRTVFVPVSLARFSRLLVEWQDKRHTGDSLEISWDCTVLQ